MPKNPDHLSGAAYVERPLLADWAAQAILGKPCPWPLGESPSDIESAKEFFQAEGIGPLCHYTLQVAGAEALEPKAVWELLRQQRQGHAALELVRGHQEEQVVQWLTEVGLRPLVLKGAAYARTLYPEAHLRPRCDMDLLFPDKETAQKAWLRLEQEGYELQRNVVEGRFVSRQRTCVKPSYGGHAVDIHWAVSNTHTFVRALPYNELNENAVPLPRLHEQAKTLGPVDSLLFACLHLFGHQRSEASPPLLWVYDISLLSRQLSASDWEVFGRKAIDKGIAGICRQVLDQANKPFPLPGTAAIRPALVEAEPREVFRPDRLKSQLLFHLHDIKALENWGERFQWICESLLPSPAYMRNKYEASRNAWLPLLYLHRTATGLARRLPFNALRNPWRQKR